MTSIDHELVDLAWKMSDNLLESEIAHLRKGIRSCFPKKMHLILEEIRTERNIWVQKFLKLAGGNLAKDNIHPERIFVTLSSGEKKRLLVTLAEAESCFSEIDLLILDEPFAHLDTESIELQLKAIQRLTTPVKFIISHHHQEMIFHYFKHFHSWSIS